MQHLLIRRDLSPQVKTVSSFIQICIFIFIEHLIILFWKTAKVPVYCNVSLLSLFFLSSAFVYFPYCIFFYGGTKGVTEKRERSSTLIIYCGCCIVLTSYGFVVLMCLFLFSSPRISWWTKDATVTHSYNKLISFLSYHLKLLSKI